jgi:CHASE3 domain sensor protein
VISLFRNLTTRQLTVIGCAVPLLCTLLIGLLQWQAVSGIYGVRDAGRKTRAIQLALGIFRYSVSDAESAEFRYVLSRKASDGDDKSGDVGLYRKLMAQADVQFQFLRTATADSALQTKYMAELEPLFREKQKVAEQTIALEQSGNDAGSLEIISSDAVRQNFLKIEGIVESMQFIETQVLIQRQFAWAHLMKVTSALSIAGMLLNLGCIVGILFLLRRMERLQSAVTLEAVKDLLRYEDGTVTIEEFLRRRSEALTLHGRAQIEAERMLSQVERHRVRPKVG